ncbi:unnamed protein product, partial [Allacma fusca]
TRGQKHCICRRRFTDYDPAMVECTGYHEWCHGNCANVDVDAAGEDSSWLCSRCHGVPVKNMPTMWQGSVSFVRRPVDVSSIPCESTRRVAVTTLCTDSMHTDQKKTAPHDSDAV